MDNIMNTSSPQCHLEAQGWRYVVSKPPIKQTPISILLSIPRNGFGPSSKSTHLAHLVTAAFVTRVDMAFTLPVGGAVAIRFAVDLRGTSEFDP